MILCVLIHNVASKSKKKIGLGMGARALVHFLVRHASGKTKINRRKNIFFVPCNFFFLLGLRHGLNGTYMAVDCATLVKPFLSLPLLPSLPYLSIHPLRQLLPLPTSVPPSTTSPSNPSPTSDVTTTTVQI
ncbi:hypothetical protein GLYMA_08G020701v4 [Glycine max]|nr:hypothetical protein GLYMA_08G020701v4 [Glycine max]KAH1049205.1 hypothetical protein GYH30_019984 [Glycine max]